MPILRSDVVAQVREIVQDKVETYRWSDDELTGFVNQALSRVAVLRPDLFADIQTIPVTQGDTVQTMPDNCLRLIELHYADFGGVRTAIKEVNREILNRADPGWYGRSSGTPREYMRNPRNSRQYFLSPPPAAGVSVTAEYSVSPGGDGDEIAHLPEGYFTTVVDATVFILESSDDSSVNEGRARLFYESFSRALATGLQVREVTDTPAGGVDNTAETPSNGS